MDFLRSIFDEDHFSEQDFEGIASKFSRKTFAKNENIALAGKRANCYWFLESGFARSFVISAEGQEVTTKFFSKGSIVIDWYAFLTQSPHLENIQTLQQCVCWEIGISDFNLLFNQHEKFRESGKQRLVESYLRLQQYSNHLITCSAEERYLHLMKETPEVLQHIPLKYIASYLGVTDTSLSRIRKEIAGI